MAKQSFRGAVATQYYRWGYICEHCGKTVEKRSTISSNVGSMHKSTAWTYTTHAGAKTMEEEAAQKLIDLKTQMDEKSQTGTFEIPEKEDGKCPFCKKYQHWAKRINNRIAERNDPKKNYGNGSKAAIGCGSIFIGIFVWIIILILANAVFKADLGNAASAIIIISCSLVIFFIAIKLIKKDNTELDAQIKALELSEKKTPYFIAWEEMNTDTIGLSKRG